MKERELRALADAQPVPAVPAIKERGPWSADREGRHIWIESNDFTHDGRLYVNGNFESNDQRFAYAQEIARRLNAAPAAPQTDALPVAPIALVRAFNSGYMQGHHDTVEAQFIVIHPLDMDTYHADVVAELGLTAAPQAEPCIGNDPACPCQDGDACHYKDAADGTKAWPVPQAEPKREPLSDEQIELPDYLRLQIASTAAAHDVLVERRRQIESEGWTPEHDDEHSLGEMAALAAFYAVPDGVHEWDFSSTGYGATLAEALLPSGWTAKAGKNRRRNLVKAGALILAEIERLDRMGGSDAE